ncbi:uncharacterized protein LACBIDRAFT_330939 [Laccaria bicolor S238N-H82]|uniref:Predicted protein n=1 Tax=Laccaria bicolor (strain S238N-H82 / ATCC MYA-4686) TaxID=486041 RepID=B0DMQ9_LACBS|nr:uncharacterized protein LACBIDRAFT_330939 [Laccaria bicolor S238N-H82]EDR04098.1 predicted protein [Laccaria bicolor S238N-H82]|eukprot:XP_001885353.1 predicted protein [Laccaria bicolor S238N-H82]
MLDLPQEKLSRDENCRACATPMTSAAPTQSGAVATYQELLKTSGWDEASAVLEVADAALETVYDSPAVTDPAQSSFSTDPVANFDNRWIPGVYRGAHHLSGNSTGTPGGTVQRFTDKDHALAAYHAAVIAGNALEVTVTTTRRVIMPSDPVTIVD